MPKLKNTTRATAGTEPYVANYPPLYEWLHKHEMRCDFQLPIGRSSLWLDLPQAFLERWSSPKTGRSCMILVMDDRRGWEIFTASDTNKIAKSLADAEERMGLTVPSPLALRILKALDKALGGGPLPYGLLEEENARQEREGQPSIGRLVDHEIARRVSK